MVVVLVVEDYDLVIHRTPQDAPTSTDVSSIHLGGDRCRAAYWGEAVGGNLSDPGRQNIETRLHHSAFMPQSAYSSHTFRDFPIEPNSVQHLDSIG